MKICKNCGKATGEDKVRCPYCGYLFEEDLDSVLSKMKSNLNAYKEEVASAQPAAQPAAQSAVQPAVQPATQPAAEASQKERFELLTEVAQLKGELKALHGEIDRMNGMQSRYYAAPAAEPAAQKSSEQPAAQPAPQAAQPVYYAQTYPPMPYAVQQPYAAPAAPAAQRSAPVSKKRTRSANRIVISVIALIMLGLSIAFFFTPWMKGTYEFSGLDSLKYLYEKLFNNGGNERMQAFLDYIRTVEFAQNEMLASVCRTVCYRVVEFGIPVYFVLLVLGFPLLFSMFGKVRGKGWHLFCAWTSFIVAGILTLIFWWIGQFNALTTLFLVGAGANFVRVLFLLFFKGKKTNNGGLE